MRDWEVHLRLILYTDMQVTQATTTVHVQESPWIASTAFTCGPLFLKQKATGYKVSHGSSS